MDHEEPFQQLAVGDLRRVERHLHHLGVPGAVVAHVLVGGRVGGAAHVAALGARHAGADLEPVLGAPEAAAGEIRGHGGGGHGGVLLRRIGACGCGGLAARQASRVLGERVRGQRALVVELERGGIQAVTQAGGLGAVLEHVAEVRAAAGAVDLVAHHAVAGVALGAHVHRVDRRVEAGPSGAGVELVLAREERQAAHDARVRALLVVVEEVPAERGLGACVLGDAVGLGRELRRELLHHGRRERGHVVAGLRSGGSGCGLGVHGGGALFGRGAGDEVDAGERGKQGDGNAVHVHWRLRDGSVGRNGPACPAARRLRPWSTRKDAHSWYGQPPWLPAGHRWRPRDRPARTGNLRRPPRRPRPALPPRPRASRPERWRKRRSWQASGSPPPNARRSCARWASCARSSRGALRPARFPTSSRRPRHSAQSFPVCPHRPSPPTAIRRSCRSSRCHRRCRGMTRLRLPASRSWPRCCAPRSSRASS